MQPHVSTVQARWRALRARNAPDGSGRRTLNIYIDSSETNPNTGQTYTPIYNGTQNAVTAWNAATNGSSCGSSQTGYYLQLNQSGGTGQADIIISNGSPHGKCAENQISYSGSTRLGPDQIYLHSYLQNTSDANATIVIKHELGHSLGLNNSVDYGGCGGTDSIMSIAASTNLCNCTVPNDYMHDIQSVDVLRSNVNLNNPGSCQISTTASNALPDSCPETSSDACVNYWNDGRS